MIRLEVSVRPDRWGQSDKEAFERAFKIRALELVAELCRGRRIEPARVQFLGPKKS